MDAHGTADQAREGRQRWQRRYDEARKRDADFSTLSGLEVDPVYGPPAGAVIPGFERIGWPGEYPFTRGLYPAGYRGRSWTIRQFSGFGNAAATNERYKMLLRGGGGGLSVAFDMPTLMGRDSDDPRALGEVGHCGVAIDSAADMDILFDGIPLADVTTSMTISGPAVPVFCMYLAAAERQGAGLGALNGTLQTDIFKAHIDFFEEIAKFRAARRIWARWMRDVYGARTERAQWLRFHTQTAGVSLTAQQPDNNVVRTAVEALAAVLGGTNSLHTNALDEVLALPSERAAEIAVRTQQVIMEETGAASVADPLGGSWFVEALTDRLEREAEEIFARIKAMSPDDSMTGGILRGIEDGWFTAEIAEAAFAYQQKLEKGEKKIVGVNCHTETIHEPLEILRVSHEIERGQVRALAELRAGRDQAAVDSALSRMVETARTRNNMIPAILDAARADATLGEICDALRAVWGSYSEPARF